MKLANISFAFLFILLCITGALAQTSTTQDLHDTRPQYIKNTDIDRSRQNEQVRKVVEQSRSVSKKSVGRQPTEESRRETEKEKREALDEINRLLAVPLEYQERYKEFLKRKNTGLSRMFPERGCDKGLVVSVQDLERCSDTAPIRGAGSRYSFRLNKIPNNLPLGFIHGLIARSDIHFTSGKFVVGTKDILDIISDIGEVDLATVTLKSDSLKFLRSFDPEDTVEKIERQRKLLSNGVSENGFVYSTSATIIPNQTYILRSIAFGENHFSFWKTDVITVFKVVGQEKDGTVILLWKELKESHGHNLRSW